MRSTKESDRLLGSVRMRICAKCPRFSGYKGSAAADREAACEAKCELIARLPELAMIAERRDPMLQRPSESARRAIEQILAESPRSSAGAKAASPLCSFRRDLADLLVDLSVATEHRRFTSGFRDHAASEYFLG